MQDLLNQLLSKLNFLSEDNKVSITNITVAVFVLITAIRALLGGSEIDLGFFKWSIQNVDYASSLPLLFALFNYSHKRSVINDNKESK